MPFKPCSHDSFKRMRYFCEYKHVMRSVAEMPIYMPWCPPVNKKHHMLILENQTHRTTWHLKPFRRPVSIYEEVSWCKIISINVSCRHIFHVAVRASESAAGLMSALRIKLNLPPDVPWRNTSALKLWTFSVSSEDEEVPVFASAPDRPAKRPSADFCHRWCY